MSKQKIVVALSLFLSVAAWSGSLSAQDNSQGQAQLSNEPKPVPQGAQNNAPMHDKLYGTFTLSGIFDYQWTQDQPGTSRRLLAGWGVTPELNVTKHLGVQGDFISMYGSDAYPGVSQFMMMAGPRYTMNPYWKGTPFFFGEAGETRTTYGKDYANGTYLPHPGPDWEPTASAGVGFDMKLTRRFALQVVPAQWTAQRSDSNGTWQNNYMARLGLVFDLR